MALSPIYIYTMTPCMGANKSSDTRVGCSDPFIGVSDPPNNRKRLLLCSDSQANIGSSDIDKLDLVKAMHCQSDIGGLELFVVELYSACLSCCYLA